MKTSVSLLWAVWWFGFLDKCDQGTREGRGKEEDAPGMESCEMPRFEGKRVVRLDEFSQHMRNENYYILYGAQLVS